MYSDDLKYDRRCVIIGASPEISGHELIRGGDYVIICDGGLRYALDNNIKFDVLLGDFDSYSGVLPEGSFETLVLPAEKDDTDTMYAARYAIDKGYRNIIMLGACGGRSDHFLGNICVGGFIADNGGICVLVNDRERFYIYANNALTLHRTPDTVISLFPLGDKLEGVTLTGFKYSLDKATITSTFPIGVSNEFNKETDTSVIEITKGIGIVIVSK